MTEKWNWNGVPRYRNWSSDASAIFVPLKAKMNEQTDEVEKKFADLKKRKPFDFGKAFKGIRLPTLSVLSSVSKSELEGIRSLVTGTRPKAMKGHAYTDIERGLAEKVIEECTGRTICAFVVTDQTKTETTTRYTYDFNSPAQIMTKKELKELADVQPDEVSYHDVVCTEKTWTGHKYMRDTKIKDLDDAKDYIKKSGMKGNCPEANVFKCDFTLRAIPYKEKVSKDFVAVQFFHLTPKS